MDVGRQWAKGREGPPNLPKKPRPSQPIQVTAIAAVILAAAFLARQQQQMAAAAATAAALAHLKGRHLNPIFACSGNELSRVFLLLHPLEGKFIFFLHLLRRLLLHLHCQCHRLLQFLILFGAAGT